MRRFVTPGCPIAAHPYAAWITVGPPAGEDQLSRVRVRTPHGSRASSR
jgi:hypothetical protein